MPVLPTLPTVPSTLTPNSTPTPNSTLTPNEFEEPPTLPQGDTALPMWPAQSVQSEQTPVNANLTPNDEFLGLLGVMPAEHQKIVMEWFPFVWHTNSIYLDNIQLRTPQQILDHVDGYVAAQQAEINQRDKVTRIEERSQRIAKRQTKQMSGTLWQQWIDSCQRRKEWIASKKAEYEKRKLQREEVRVAWQTQMDAALMEWNTYVNTAQVEYQEAKATQVPTRP